MTLLDLYKRLEGTGIPVGIYDIKQEELPYMVYEDVNTRYTNVSGVPFEEITQVSIYYFTKKNFDPNLEIIKNLLHRNKLLFTIATNYNYDDDTKMYHFDLSIINPVEVIENDKNH